MRTSSATRGSSAARKAAKASERALRAARHVGRGGSRAERRGERGLDDPMLRAAEKATLTGSRRSWPSVEAATRTTTRPGVDSARSFRDAKLYEVGASEIRRMLIGRILFNNTG
jgi:hypothetical protein